MTRWDLIDEDHREDENPEEYRLLKKFNEYLDLEKYAKKQKESSKGILSEKSLKKPFVGLALIEGTILVGLVTAFMILLNYQ